jgi:putative oxidoreductase
MGSSKFIISSDVGNLLFRIFFSFMFIVLGTEHLFCDALLQVLVPEWMPHARLASIACGLCVLFGGGSILLGWKTRYAAIALGLFLITVTIAVHIPGVSTTPEAIPSEYVDVWVFLQRSNFSKNLCLLGVCFLLLNHDVGKYSVEGYLARRRAQKK